jgi:hypothetical protein
MWTDDASGGEKKIIQGSLRETEKEIEILTAKNELNGIQVKWNPSFKFEILGRCRKKQAKNRLMQWK